MKSTGEDAYERQVLSWLPTCWQKAFGPDIAPGGNAVERDSLKEVVLKGRLIESLKRLNPELPQDALIHLFQDLESPGEADIVKANETIINWLVNGINIKYRNSSGEDVSTIAKVVDFENPLENDWLAVNQYSVQHDKGSGTRRPDVVFFLNGLPIIVMELKSPDKLDEDIWKAFNQLQTYKEHISRLFFYNIGLVIADGVDARVGSLTADQERFSRWRSVDGINRDPYGTFGHMQSLVEGFLNPEAILSVLKDFTIFVKHKNVVKLFPAYHQYFAVLKAYERSVTASAEDGDGRGGLMWHTTGAGKSYEMAALAGKLVSSKKLKNPTILVVTDRKNLDRQLFETFADASSLLRQNPEMAESRDDLRDKIESKPAGGVIFTTIQKFAPEKNEEKYPVLSDRRNLFVFTDEAHRSQYGFTSKLDKDGFKVGYAQHLRDALPNATFVAFTGTPIEENDRDTRQVFGDEIDVYDMAQSVEDGATVPIFYESRLVQLELPDEAKKELDALAEELIEDEEDSVQANLKKRWAELEQIVGAEPRIEKIAQDIVNHFENRCKAPELQDGKAMIVGMSRNICVDIYNQIIKIRPEWHDEDFRKGSIKIIFHASASDSEKIRPHVYTESQKEELEQRFKDPDDPLKMVIVRDMWLTGYDSPPCHTMYVDKPMKGLNLMQAIARVNRVFKDKPGGLVVDYIGIATELKEALGTYTKGKRTKPPIDFIEEALAVFFEKLTVIRDMLHGCDMSGFKNNPHAVLPVVADFILGLEEGPKRFADSSAALSKAYALVNSQDSAIKHREEVAFYQAIRVMLTKSDTTIRKLKDAEREALIRQALSRGIVPDGIIDVYSLSGLSRPNIGLLSEEFLREIRAMKEKNLAVEALSRLLKDEIKARFSKNIVRNAQFSELLDAAISRYRNRSIETAQLIEELIELAKKINAQIGSEANDSLSEYEIAFYDALESNELAVREMKHDTLVQLAQELTKKVRENVKVDWSVRESTQAALRIMIRDLLDKYGYPPDFSKQAVETVIRQAESLTEEWLSQSV